MGGSGTPEPSAKRLGEIVARIRTSRELSRAKLVLRIHDHNPSLEISESILRGIEEGIRVKTSREVLEALCSALTCSPIERMRIMLAADRNILADADGNVSPDDELLLCGITHIKDHPVARKLLESMMKDKKSTDLTQVEINRMMLTLIQSITEASSVSIIANNRVIDDSSSLSL